MNSPQEDRELAIEAATKFIYEDKGDRKGIHYIGWDAEPEDVKESWREDVRATIRAYEDSLSEIIAKRFSAGATQ